MKKIVQNLNMPWEKEYGYAQAVQHGNTVWLSGQLGHDDKGVLATGMEAQMKQTYSNIKLLLSKFDMTMGDVVEEVLYVTDMSTAFETRKNYKDMFYPEPGSVASTIVAVSGLALSGQLVEIK